MDFLMNFSFPMTAVCERVMEAASAMLCAQDLPLEMVLHFISTLPREFTDFGGEIKKVFRPM